MLARCRFSTGHFSDAAEHYEKGLTQSEYFSGHGQQLLRSVAISYSQAGDEVKAEQILQRLISEFPGQPEGYKQLAAIQAQRTDYKAAYESLRKAVELEPELESETGVRVGLAIGGALETSEELWAAVKPTNEVYQAITALLQEYWPRFASLDVKAQEEWIFGTWQLHFFPQQGQMKNMRQRKAAVAVATAVEIELREKVFSEFRKYVMSRQEFCSNAKAGLEEKESKPLCQNLIDNAPLTFGQMTYILRCTRRSSAPIFTEMASWLQRTHPNLTGRLSALSKICDIRNPSVHGNQVSIDPEGIRSDCKDVIDSILSISQP